MRRESEIIGELLHRKQAGQLNPDTSLGAGDYSPLTSSSVADAEAELGFALPTMLRTIYTEVANGGFGYAYGLLGLKGGMLNEDGNDATQQYLDYRRPDPTDPHWAWPQGLLPIGHLGCAMYHCVQCNDATSPIIWFEPNPHEDGEPWDSSFIPFCSSLVEYFAAWLDGKDLFDEFLNE